jgi:ribosome biogenesis protein NSA2
MAIVLYSYYLIFFKVNISELGLVTQGGKVVWGKFAQVTNNPELDGCVNAVLLV